MPHKFQLAQVRPYELCGYCDKITKTYRCKECNVCMCKACQTTGVGKEVWTAFHQVKS